MFKQTKIFLLLILLYVSSYYGWIIIFSNSPALLEKGGSFFSIIGLIVALSYLVSGIRQSHTHDRTFWYLICLGTFFYLIAELIWLFEESFLRLGMTFPGWSDVFYILQLLCLLYALIYRIIRNTAIQERISFLFDVMIILVVASTFSWHFLIAPIVQTSVASKSALLVSLIYPIGDLGMLVAVTFMFFNLSHQKKEASIYLIIIAVLIQAIADSVYLYLIAQNAYLSGSWIDPLFIIAMIILSFSSLVQNSESVARRSPYNFKKLNMIQMITPYGGVLILFVFMGFHSNSFDIITIGSGISILLVIVRQILIIFENHKLVRRYYEQTQMLEISEERYRSLFEYHPDAVYSTDLNGKFDSANAACSDILGLSKLDLMGRSSLSFIKTSHQAQMVQELQKVFTGEPRNYEVVIESAMGSSRNMNITNIPIIVRNEIVGIFGIGKDVTEVRQTEEKIHYLAYHDILTGLSNRLAFEERLFTLVESNVAKPASKVSLFFMDLNQFKQVNDTLGHDVGDQLLKAVAERLRSFETQFDMMARQGGDEFTLLLKDAKSHEQIHNVAAQLLKTLQAPYHIGNHEISCPPSIGIACYPTDATSMLEMLKYADFAMYQAKNIRSGSYFFYSDLHSTSM